MTAQSKGGGVWMDAIGYVGAKGYIPPPTPHLPMGVSASIFPPYFMARVFVNFSKE
jgi:hypothetical protein